MQPCVVSRRTVLGGAVTAALLPMLASKALADASSEIAVRPFRAEMEGGKPRFLHTATVMSDGRILFVGGYHVDPERLHATASNSVEILEPGSGEWFEAAPLTLSRARHAAVLLQDGRVAVLGGFNRRPMDSVEIYDPYADSWALAAPLDQPLCDHVACLAGGQIVISGGRLGVPAAVHVISGGPSRPLP